MSLHPSAWFNQQTKNGKLWTPVTQKQKSTEHREFAEVVNEAQNIRAKKKWKFKKEGRKANKFKKVLQWDCVQQTTSLMVQTEGKRWPVEHMRTVKVGHSRRRREKNLFNKWRQECFFMMHYTWEKNSSGSQILLLAAWPTGDCYGCQTRSDLSSAPGLQDTKSWWSFPSQSNFLTEEGG